MPPEGERPSLSMCFKKKIMFHVGVCCCFFFLSTVEQVSHLISQMVFALLKPHLLIILHWKGKGKSKLLSDIQAVSLGWTKINQSCTISCSTGHLSGVLTGYNHNPAELSSGNVELGSAQGPGVAWRPAVK